MTESWLRTPAQRWARRAALGGAVVVVGVATLLWGRADVQVDGPVVRQETAWFRGASEGSDGVVGGLLEVVDGCVLLGGLPVVWPETVGWDDDSGQLLVDGRAAWAGTSQLHGDGGVTDDFAATAARWDDGDVTPDTAPCHFHAEEVVVFDADAELSQVLGFE